MFAYHLSLNSKMTLTGAGLILFLTISHTLTDALTSTFSALLPTLQARYALTETTLALLVATLSFSNSVMQPLFGVLADRFGKRAVGVAGMILNAVILSLVGIAPNVPALFGLLLIGGLGSAAFHPALMSLAGSSSGKKRELAVSLFSAGGTAGLSIGPVVILLLVANQGLGAMPWLMVPGILMGGLLYLLAPNEKTDPRKAALPAFDWQLLRGPVGLLTLSGILSSIAFVTFTSAMPLWLVKERNLSVGAPVIGWTLAAFTLAAALGSIAAGLLSRRFPRERLVSGSLGLALLPLFGVLLTEPGTLPFFGLVMLAGALVNAGLPLMIISAQDLAPQSLGAVSGMLMGFTVGIAGILYIGIGKLQEVIGLTAAMQISYLVLLPAALLAFLALRHKQNRSQEVQAGCLPAAC
jgi:FSR family fosmidomycin resistance protein-like MFS transporter